MVSKSRYDACALGSNGQDSLLKLDEYAEQVIREAAYFIWKREGRPEGHAQDHWQRATIGIFGDNPGLTAPLHMEGFAQTLSVPRSAASTDFLSPTEV